MGTSSLRRRAFLRRLRPDLTLLELRGNVPTRIERLQRGDYDAIVLAAAGLHAWRSSSTLREYLSAESFPPAVSQGAIGVCTRSGDDDNTALAAAAGRSRPALATTAERALLERIGRRMPGSARRLGDA